VEGRTERAAATQAVTRIAIEANRREPDFSSYVNEARTLAEAQALEFLDIVQQDGTIISSAHAAARFGYRIDWLIAPEDWAEGRSFLTRIPLLEGTAVGLAAVDAATAGDRRVFVVGAKKLDAAFLGSLGVAPGVRALLWLSTGQLIDATGPVSESERLTPLIDRVQHGGSDATAEVQWGSDPESAEYFTALPLRHRGNLLGALLVGSSLQQQVWLENFILWTGVSVGGTGILLGVLLGWWTTARVTRPVAQLVAGAHAVAGGQWETRVEVASQDEIGELAQAFNRMTEQLIEQRDRTIQAERVAAWRELARRLAHELKNPLFPLQITIENLQRAREQHPDQFDEVFRESTATLLAELQHLKTIIGQFSDFAKMPKPEIEVVDANGMVREVMKLFDAQLRADGRPRIEPVLDLTDADTNVPADPLQLTRALKNLVLNAMDAMPEGGVLRLRTERLEDAVRIQVSDTGRGLTEEETARLFTPYYTTKRHGTGLGLAIVQSVVADHRGRISAAGEPGRGATFTMDLPLRRET
jgi:signal transduction histidine kinase